MEVRLSVSVLRCLRAWRCRCLVDVFGGTAGLCGAVACALVRTWLDVRDFGAVLENDAALLMDRNITIAMGCLW